MLLGSWTDSTPLTSGAYLSLRTDATKAQFDDLAVSDGPKYHIIPGGDYLGGQRIALCQGNTLSYLLTDHLGSPSAAHNPTAGTTVTQRYKAWGEARGPSGALPTTYRFTGQRKDNGSGLLFYNARWYDPHRRCTVSAAGNRFSGLGMAACDFNRELPLTSTATVGAPTPACPPA